MTAAATGAADGTTAAAGGGAVCAAGAGVVVGGLTGVPPVFVVAAGCGVGVVQLRAAGGAARLPVSGFGLSGGADPAEAGAIPPDLAGLRIGVMEQFYDVPVQACMHAAVRKAAPSPLRAGRPGELP